MYIVSVNNREGNVPHSTHGDVDEAIEEARRFRNSDVTDTESGEVIYSRINGEDDFEDDDFLDCENAMVEIVLTPKAILISSLSFLAGVVIARAFGKK